MPEEVQLETFAAACSQGAYVLDVRETDEYRAGHVPGALPLPMSQVHERLRDLPRSEPVYVVCASGNRSDTATDWMRAAGVAAYSVAGGMRAWVRSGRRTVAGPRAHAT